MIWWPGMDKQLQEKLDHVKIQAVNKTCYGPSKIPRNGLSILDYIQITQTPFWG